MLYSTVRAAVGCGAIAFVGVAAVAAEAESFPRRAEKAFNEAQVAARKSPTNTAALVQLSRAAFDWAEFASNDNLRADLAQRGIDAARSAIQRESTNAAAHYWLGMNLGQLARTKSLGALKLVREMEEEFLRARALDAKIDYAGPDRSLGYLYRDAPGWPTSIGNKKKAREHFDRAAELHPEFPENQLGLLESFEKWSDRQGFNRQAKAVEKCLVDARQKFTGPEWQPSRADWEKRWLELKKKAGGVGQSTSTKGAK